MKSTSEIEEFSCMSFLDVLLTKKDDGFLSHQVYWKKMHIGRYLNTDSHHHPAQKIWCHKHTCCWNLIHDRQLCNPSEQNPY